MQLTRLDLLHFRNHAETALEFGRRINLLVGDNGAGKTNVLEGISYLSLTKSFYALTDTVTLQEGAEAFQIAGTLSDDGGRSHSVRVAYDAASKHKTVQINGHRPESLSEVIGRFPVVILSPEKGAVTFGGPVERRKFIDLILSQVSRSYFRDLLEYRRVLRQRNSLLIAGRIAGGLLDDDFEAWTGALARLGARLVVQRSRFAGEFLEYVRRTYTLLVNEGEEPGLTYEPPADCTPEADEGETALAIAGALERRRAEEFRRGLTLVGPHRDELRLTLNGAAVQQHASQGQHKTLLVALKVAEFLYLRERVNETPVFLLDDLFSELDRQRSRRILELIPELGQTMITTTGLEILGDLMKSDGDNRVFEVHRGTVRAA